VSEEKNKMIVGRFIEEFWNQRKLHLADELFAPDCITHQLRSEEDAVGMPRSPESVKREAAAWLSGFPDLKFVLEKIIAPGTKSPPTAPCVGRIAACGWGSLQRERR